MHEYNRKELIQVQLLGSYNNMHWDETDTSVAFFKPHKWSKYLPENIDVHMLEMLLATTLASRMVFCENSALHLEYLDYSLVSLNM